MRTLSLLRHAKSSWDDATLGDHQRPLAKRGLRDAPRIGAFMREQGLTPDLVLCSDAVRATQTLDLVLPCWEGRQPRVEYDHALFLALPEALLRRVRAVAADVAHLMLVGHNPGLHDLATALSGTGRAKDLSALSAKFPTAALAVIELDVETWAEVGPGAGRLRLLMAPKRLGS